MLYSLQTSELVYNGETARKNFPLYKNAGFGAVDFGISEVFTKNGGNIWQQKKCPLFDLPEEEMLEFFKEIKDAAEENGIVFGQTHAPFSSQIVGRSEEHIIEYNKYLMEVIKKSIRITGYLECPYIVIHPVFGHYDTWMDKEEEYKLNIEFYSSFIPELKKYGVKACLESMWVSNKNKIYAAACNNFDEVARYIDELNGIAGEELFGFCLDTGHITLTSGNMRYAIRHLGNKIKVLHLHDVDGVNDSHTMPFIGLSDWELIMKELKAAGYSGTLNFEAANWWRTFPKELYPSAFKMIGDVGKYFVETYFK